MRPLLLALVVFALVAAPASAAPEWHEGEIESSTVTNCNFMPENGITTNAQFYADKAALPKVGDTFYVRTIPARVGNGCGINIAVHVEVVPPEGVALAITPATPVKCLLWDYTTDVATPLEGCPQVPQNGIYGPAFDQETASGPKPWAVPYLRGIVFEIPLRSSRPLKGAAGRPSNCIRVASAPCSAAAAGDNIQLATWVNHAQFHPWLVPSVPLFVEPAATVTPAPTVTPTPAPAPAVDAPAINRAPASARLAALRRGLSVRAFAGTRGSTITATLVLKGKTLAKATLRGAPAGLNTLKLRATAAGRRLKRGGAAELRVTVRAPDGSVVRGTKKVTLRR